MLREKYDKFDEKFKERNCVLVTTFDEFKLQNTGGKKPTEIKVDYIASCDHESSCVISSFLIRKNSLCKDCLKNRDLYKSEDGSSKFSKMEDDSIQYLIPLLSRTYDVHINEDGCYADLSIKKKLSDKWMRIQIKTTQDKTNSFYKFILRQSYTDSVIICVCLNDKKMWMFDGNSVTVKSFEISLNKSKYDKNQVTENTICSEIDKYFDKYELFDLSELNIPTAKGHKIEMEYRKIRENSINFLAFDYPTRTGLCYDFKIGEKKFQEKLGHYDEEHSILFHISKSNGYKKAKQQYDVGDNDFYWFVLPCKSRFLVLPEQLLIDPENDKKLIIHVCLLEETGKPNVRTTPLRKFKDYLFEYKNVDKDRLIDVINKTHQKKEKIEKIEVEEKSEVKEPVTQEIVEIEESYYNKYKKILEYRKCLLLTTNEQFDELVKNSLTLSKTEIEYRLNCEHDNKIVRSSTVAGMIKHRHFYCKICDKNNKKTTINIVVDPIDLFKFVDNRTVKKMSLENLKVSYTYYFDEFKKRSYKLETSFKEFVTLNENKEPLRITVDYVYLCNHIAPFPKRTTIWSFLKKGKKEECCNICVKENKISDEENEVDEDVNETDETNKTKLERFYDSFVKRFKERDCTFLTTFDEFKELKDKENIRPMKVSVKYALKCGHTRNMVIKSFFESENAHTNCRECV